MSRLQVCQPPAPAVWISPRTSSWNLLVLDDYATFADAIASRLNAEPGIEATAATTVEQARRVMARRVVDGLLLDLDLNPHHGLQFAAEALQTQPRVRIVVVTGADDERQVVDAVRLGVVGWVGKDEPVEHLLAVVRGTLRGETWIPPRLLTGVIASLRAGNSHSAVGSELAAILTRREHEVLSLMVAGMSADSIAAQLFLSRNTIRTHIQNLIGKLGVHSAVAAVAVARRAGWPTDSALRAVPRN
jgi:DNA-binding NarL/FixJ family response regulator